MYLLFIIHLFIHSFILSWMDGWMDGWMGGLIGWLVDWLIDWLIGVGMLLVDVSALSWSIPPHDVCSVVDGMAKPDLVDP